MDKELKQLVKQQGSKNFDLAKSNHAVIFTPKPVFIRVNTGQEMILNIITVFYIYFGFTNTLSFNLQDNVNKILSKAYVQLGRFSKQNASKTVSIFREEKDSIKLKFHIYFNSPNIATVLIYENIYHKMSFLHIKEQLQVEFCNLPYGIPLRGVNDYG